MSSLVDWLMKRYGVGPHYADAYLAYWNRTGKRSLTSVADIGALSESESLWFEFALSANWRGRQIVGALNVPDAREGGRYLDIGCGVGGMLVAYAEKGYGVHGVELDGERVALAQQNMRDIGKVGSVTCGSILDPTFVAQQQGFDVIDCIDVIEHVADPVLTLENAVSLLNDGGWLHLEIPNREATDFIAKDGHFALFGITLLPRWAAIKYQQAHFDYAYDVGDYYPLDYYERILRAHGLRVESCRSPMQPVVGWPEARAKAENLISGLAVQLKGAKEGVPRDVVPYLDGAVAGYKQSIEDALHVAVASNSAEVRDAFATRFGANFWLVCGQKACRVN